MSASQVPRRPSRAQAFIQLSEFLKHDVKNVLRMEHGGNYTAALLLLVGAESLSRIADQSDDAVFIEILHRRGLDPYVARDVFEALRHGLAHAFETKYIQIGKVYVELMVSWGEKEHLSRDREPPRLYLNVRTMWDDLKRMLGEVEHRLNVEPEWGGTTPKNWRWLHQCDPKARAGWEALFG